MCFERISPMLAGLYWIHALERGFLSHYHCHPQVCMAMLPLPYFTTALTRQYAQPATASFNQHLDIHSRCLATVGDNESPVSADMVRSTAWRHHSSSVTRSFLSPHLRRMYLRFLFQTTRRCIHRLKAKSTLHNSWVSKDLFISHSIDHKCIPEASKTPSHQYQMLFNLIQQSGLINCFKRNWQIWSTRSTILLLSMDYRMFDIMKWSVWELT